MNRIPFVLFGVLVLCVTGLRAADQPVAGAVSEQFGGRVALRATDRVPGAKARADIERRAGCRTVEMVVSHFKPATLFGGDFNTYVVWTIVRGRAENVGELSLDGDSSQLAFPAPVGDFGLIVTAEPHFMASAPSRFVILETPGDSSIAYRAESTPYNFRRDTLDGLPAAKGLVRTEVRQAISALRLARRAGAETTHEFEFSEAQRALEETLRLARSDMDSEKLQRQARETVRLAALVAGEE